MLRTPAEAGQRGSGLRFPSPRRIVDTMSKDRAEELIMKKPSPKRSFRPRNQNRRTARFSRKVEILYEDEAVVALDKPAGLWRFPSKAPTCRRPFPSSPKS